MVVVVPVIYLQHSYFGAASKFNLVEEDQILVIYTCLFVKDDVFTFCFKAMNFFTKHVSLHKLPNAI